MASKGDAAPNKQKESLLNCNPSTISSDWQFSSLSNMTDSSSNRLPICNSNVFEPFSCSRATILDFSGPVMWDQLPGTQHSCYGEVNLHHAASMPNALGIKPTGLELPRPGLDCISGLGLTPPDTMLKGGLFVHGAGGLLPPSLAHIPADSGFIERAAKYSCFSSGNFGDLVNPFSMPETAAYTHPRGPMPMHGSLEHLAGIGLNLTSEMPSQKNVVNLAESSKCVGLPMETEAAEEKPRKSEKATEDMRRPLDGAKLSVSDSSNHSGEAERSGRDGQDELRSAVRDVSSEGATSNKRKRCSKDAEPDRRLLAKSPEVMKDHTGLEEKEKQHPVSTMDKPGGKGPGASNSPKEKYIHVRAQRGQATNTHSLAERIRREKISERMKFLQDLVPGCSKVTGKAVMLDEIINYVQSLQRQIEFLSMKLATVNPQLDCDLERQHQQILQSRGAPSSSLMFPPSNVMRRPSLHQPQGLVQAGTQALGSSPDALRRSMISSLTAMVGGYNERLSHSVGSLLLELTELKKYTVSSVREDELHSIVRMGLTSRVPSCSQDISGSLAPGHMKAEP